MSPLFYLKGSGYSSTDKIKLDGYKIRNSELLTYPLILLGLAIVWLIYVLHNTALSYDTYILDPVNHISTNPLIDPISTSALSIPGLPIGSYIANILHTQGYTSASQIYTVVNILLIMDILLALIIAYIKYTRLTIKDLPRISNHQYLILASLSLISWSGHLYHISYPVELMYTYHVPYIDPTDPSYLSVTRVLSNHLYTKPIYSINEVTGSISTLTSMYHHLTLGIILLVSTILDYLTLDNQSIIQSEPYASDSASIGRSVNTIIVGISSIIESYLISTGSNPWFNLNSQVQSQVACSEHHYWVGMIVLLAGFSTLTLTLLRSKPVTTYLFNHRDTVLGHLSFISAFLGVHAFGLYIHNDVLLATGNTNGIFSDTGLSISALIQNLLTGHTNQVITNESGTILNISQESSTSLFLVCHIHAFTLHVSVFITLKGILYGKSSRLVPDKSKLGYKYACDGPGRGGTCQLSPWDHLYLSAFWYYNHGSVVAFCIIVTANTYLGKITDSATHLSNTDLGTLLSINNWLRDLLWAQSSESIQSYGTPSISIYGYAFIGAHLVWAISLMYLFSGRGYWQELIESIQYSHSKINIKPSIDPRALSITSGRLVGSTQYILASIVVTGSFLIPRIYVLST